LLRRGSHGTDAGQSQVEQFLPLFDFADQAIALLEQAPTPPEIWSTPWASCAMPKAGSTQHVHDQTDTLTEISEWGVGGDNCPSTHVSHQIHPTLAPAQCGRHVREDRLDHMAIVVDPKLVGNCQQQGIGLGDRLILS